LKGSKRINKDRNQISIPIPFGGYNIINGTHEDNTSRVINQVAAIDPESRGFTQEVKVF